MAAFDQRQEADDARVTPEAAIRAEADVDAPAQENGMECLRSAAEEQLRRNATKIATALADKAASGDLNCAKFLLLVTKESPKTDPTRRRDGPSEAERLAAEPPWQEPPAESSTEPFAESFTDIETNGMDSQG
jgi:hypothetical protein